MQPFEFLSMVLYLGKPYIVDSHPKWDDDAVDNLYDITELIIEGGKVIDTGETLKNIPETSLKTFKL